MPFIAREVDYTTPQEFDLPALEYPFESVGDFATVLVTRKFKQTLAGYLRDKAFGRYLPGTVADREIPGAILLRTTEPTPSPTGLCVFTRIFGTVPGPQILRGSYMLSKPSIAGPFPKVFGDFRIFQPDASVDQFDAYLSRPVVSHTGGASFGPTGGTYTITFAGATTGALAYDAAAGTVQVALNALAPVAARGNCTVTGTYNTGFVVTFSDYTQITIDPALLTGGPLTKAEQSTNSAYSQVVGAYKAAAWASATAEITLDIAAVTYTGAETYGMYPLCQAPNPGDTSLQYAVITYLGGPNPGRITGGTFRIVLPEGTTAPISVDATFDEVTAAMDAVVAGRYRAAAYNSSQGDTLSYENGLGGRVLSFNLHWQRSAPTGGTFTLTAFGLATGAIAYNATPATVQTALNALATVINRGNVVVAGNLKDGYTIQFSNAAFTVDTSALTPSGSAAAIAITDAGVGRRQSILFTGTSAIRDVYAPNHGIGADGAIFIKGNGTYYSGITRYQVIDTETIRLQLIYGDAYNVVTPITEIGPRVRAAYRPGLALVKCRRRTDYYLPGITAGIATPDDIALPLNQADATSLLLALLAGAGAINVQVGEMFNWRDTPIIGLTRTEVDASAI